MDLVYDTAETGLETVMKPWEAEVLKYIWSREGEAVPERDVWKHVSKFRSISRTSINKFLKRMTNRGVLINRPRIGRGGRHWRYIPRLDESTFKKRIIRKVLTNLLNYFPEGWEHIEAHQTSR